MTQARFPPPEEGLATALLGAWLFLRFGTAGPGPNASDVWVQARRHADSGWLPHDVGSGWDVPYRLAFEVLVSPLISMAGWREANTAVLTALCIALAVLSSSLMRTVRVPPGWWLAAVAGAALVPSIGAGEWLLVAAEPKGAAWVLGLAGIVAWLRRRDAWAWGLLGAAASFHVLVGGGLALGVGVATLWQREAPRLRWMSVAALTGAPALLALARTPLGGDPAVFETYVQARMAHHLLPDHWQAGWPLRLVGALVGIAVAWRWRPDTRPLLRVALGTTPLALVGLGLWLAGRVDLLRFFWFRVPDALLPLAAVVGLAALGGRWPRLGWAVGVVGVLAVGLPTRARGPTPMHDALAEHVAPDERVFADPTDATLTLHSGRARVVSWKQVPHDGAQLAVWLERMEAATGGPLPVGGLAARAEVRERWAALPWAERVAVAERYGAQWVVAPLDALPGGVAPTAEHAGAALVRLEPEE